MVLHLKTAIISCLNCLLWFYVLIDSESSCMAMLAQPYPVSGPTPMPLILNLLHCIGKCLELFWEPESCQFSLESVHFVYKVLEHCIEIYICLSTAPVCYLCFEVEGLSPDFEFDPVFELLFNLFFVILQFGNIHQGCHQSKPSKQ